MNAYDIDDKRDLSPLYIEHIHRQQTLAERLCQRFDLDYLLIASGTLVRHFADDRTFSFKVNPFFKQWLPLTEHSDSYLLVVPGQKPTLFLHQPDDIWEQWPDLTHCDWSSEATLISIFTVVPIKQKKVITSYLAATKKAGGSGAFIGPKQCLHSDWLIERINDELVLAFMQYHRRVKSSYEIHCIYKANLAAAPGHRRALQLFLEGASEAEIFWAYLAANAITEYDNPYSPIIGINEHSAILHYRQKSTVHPASGSRSLLIDAGASFAGYASDITRTYSYKNDDFADLIRQFDQLQQGLVSQIEVGMTQAELYKISYQEIANFMRSNQLINCSAEQAIETKLVDEFYPHGLGHLLGLQVHDVGGAFGDERGAKLARDSCSHSQRKRPIESGMVFTVEPGFYFIEKKLDTLQAGSFSGLVNWKRVNLFRPYGGIRIEDNVAVIGEDVVNFTRTAL